jgi:hypothetical protein
VNLYKYLPPSRIDVLEKCLIRFTQLGDFNDPFELNPHINKIAEQDEIKKLVDRNFEQLIEDEYSNNPLLAAFISKQSFIQLAKGKEALVKNAVLGMEQQVVSLLPGILQYSANSLLGALSLSELSNHELMWSHYAAQHKGYVIGFDRNHSFFNQKITPDDELRHLEKINYLDKPPEINLMHAAGAELFFAKSVKWEYEVEWRMLLPLSESSEKIENSPFPFYLFHFPSDAVKEVILGARVSSMDRYAIEALMNKPKFSHVKLFQANLDPSSYEIVITHAN